MYVVITKNGFLTTKKKEDILETDTVVREADKEECSRIIHGISKKK